MVAWLISNEVGLGPTPPTPLWRLRPAGPGRLPPCSGIGDPWRPLGLPSGMDYHNVYASGADRYHELVSAEDVDGNLGPAIAPFLPTGSRVVEVGAGTGRLTRVLHSLGLDVLATEPSAAMLSEAVQQRTFGAGRHPCRAEALHLPVRSSSFDAAVAGWVFGHQILWRPSDWQAAIAGFIAECGRVTGNGTVLLIETLGTGAESPDPPPELLDYFAWLEHDHSFERRWIRTDYAFPNVELAAKAVGGFFGADLADAVRRHRWSRVPECTGIWVRRAVP